ncbi:putative AMP-binding enzyme [Halenospora varia]|nr:putative AMP-binding enzyme [Halenospora varia]
MALFNASLAELRSLLRVPIPNKDLLSYIFENTWKYDQDMPIMIDTNDPKHEYLSINQAHTMIRKLISGFKRAGLKTGDCVCLQSSNNIYYPIICLAVVGAGGVFTGSNPGLRLSEVVHHYKTSKTQFIISVEEILPINLEAASQCDIPASNVFLFAKRPPNSPQSTRYWTDLLQCGEEDWIRWDDEKRSRNTVAALYPTSGTSGKPKFAMISHYNLVAAGTLAHDTNVKSFKTKQIILFPMFHIAATVFSHVSPIRQGWPTYIIPRFEPVSVVSIIRDYQITDMGMVPAMMNMILQSGVATPEALSSLRDGAVGAAPVNPEILKKWQALCHPDCSFGGKYGMTELTGIATQIPWPEKDRKVSVGRLLAGLEAKLVDDNGNKITKCGVPGELRIRGSTVFMGYLGNAEETAAAFDEEGYLRTGDVAYCDAEDKTLFIIDRMKELIKVRGFQVAPAELEGLLLSHDAIADAAVIGVPTANGEEVPRAYLVRSVGKGALVTADEIKTYIAERLSKYKHLDGGVIFMSVLPRNSNGKLLKRVLRDEVKKGEKSKL